MIVYVARALTATGRCARCEPCGEEDCGTEDSDDTPHSFSLGGNRLSRGLPATGAGCHFFFFRVKAPPIIRLTRLMLQVIRRGCATSHASGIHPAPIETILGTLSKVDSPMGSPETAGAAAGRLANDCGCGRCCVVDSAFSAFGAPVLESSADTPESSRLPALSWRYLACTASRSSCFLQSASNSRFSACSLFSGVCGRVVVVMRCVCNGWSVFVVFVIHQHIEYSIED